MKIAKIGVMVIVLFIASAGMGMSYASITGIPASISEEPSCDYGKMGIRIVDHVDTSFDTVYVNNNRYQSDKDVGSSSFTQPDVQNHYLVIEGETVFFCNKDDPSPSININDAYPCYANSITIMFANCGQGTEPTASILDVSQDKTSDYIEIDNFQIEIKNSDDELEHSCSGVGMTNLFNTLETDEHIKLQPEWYMILHIDYHLNNDLPESDVLPEKLFDFKFTWWGLCP